MKIQKKISKVLAHTFLTTVLSANALSIAGLVTATSVFTSQAFAYNVQDYNNELIHYGISWSSSEASFMPGLYLGFAPRIETANRIHFRLGRGNQIRLTGVVDEFTVLSYLYNLKARYELIKKSIDNKYIKPAAQNQFIMFEKVIQSEGVLQTITDLESHKISEQEFYNRSLNLMKKLNPGRVFSLKIDLSAALQQWNEKSLKNFIAKAGSAAKIKEFAQKNAQMTITLLNEMLIGRINAYSVSSAVLDQLQVAALSSVSAAGNNANQLMSESLKLFNLATENRYSVITDGQSSIQCDQSCILKIHEFTAIYPNGSTIDATKDRDGNRIPRIREVGALNFLDRDYHDVDHIRSESYYGWAPKMDYTKEGNGIHNPAVRTSLRKDAFKDLTAKFNIPAKHNNLWIVSRGNVSHGCTRMASGHILEVRNIFPTANAEMLKVKYFGNDSSDYDLFDIDGSGQLKVMGVKYYLSYGLESEQGDGYREGKFLIPQSLNREAFYADLYGKGQFREQNGEIIFVNPYISQFSLAKSTDIRAKAFSQQYKGEFSLYEQDYEKDKMQLFSMASPMMSSLSQSNNHTSSGKRLVRLFGRAISCGPFAAKFPQCAENVYRSELNQLEAKITKMK